MAEIPDETIVLRHLALYRMSLAPVIETACLGGRSSKNLLARLRAEKKIQSARGAIGKLAYYQLHRRMTHELEVPESRAAPIGAAALPRHLAVLWYCCMTRTRRGRIENDFAGLDDAGELRELPGDDPHCIEYGSDTEPAQLQRLLVPGTDQGETYHVEKLRDLVETMQSLQALRSWLDSRSYAFVFLVENDGKQDKFRALLDAEPYTDAIDWRVELAPGPATLKDYLDAVSNPVS